MVASQAALEENPVTVALQMAAEMEALADAGEWERIEEIAVQLRAAVMNVPVAERSALLLAVQRSTDKVAAGAKQARQTVSDKISELRRGQVAKKAYELR
ncbi:MAG: hypothetical protein WBN07_11870 [Woeseiaceae bacterium]